MRDTNSSTENTSPSPLSRRGLLQAGAALLATPVVLGGLSSLGLAASGATDGTTKGAAGAAQKGRADLPPISQPPISQPPISQPPVSLPLISKKRTLGSGAYSMAVSALGFGVMGCNYNRGVHPPEKDMVYLIGQAVEHGVTLFDTAQIYGPLKNEELAGKALAPYKGRVAVTTKFGHKIVNGVYETGKLDSTPANIRKVAEESLKRLGVDAIEMFYQHRYDPAVPMEDVAGTVKDLIKEGKVKRFGLCEVGPETIRRAHAVQPVTAVQSEYHLMWREPEKDIFPVLQELGIGFVPYSPLNRGFLGGDMTEYTRFDSGNDNRNTLPRFTPEGLRANLLYMETLHRFGRARGVTGAQVALAWMLAKKDWIVPIPGTTKLSHLEENLRAADLVCTPKEWAELEASLAQIRIVGDRYPAEQQKQVQRK